MNVENCGGTINIMDSKNGLDTELSEGRDVETHESERQGSISLGRLHADARVKCDGDSFITEFLDDIRNGAIYVDKSGFEEGLRPLLAAGVPVSWEPSTSNGESGDDWEGSFDIKKGDLNEAIRAGKLGFKIYGEGGDGIVQVET